MKTPLEALYVKDFLQTDRNYLNDQLELANLIKLSTNFTQQLHGNRITDREISQILLHCQAQFEQADFKTRLYTSCNCRKICQTFLRAIKVLDLAQSSKKFNLKKGIMGVLDEYLLLLSREHQRICKRRDSIFNYMEKNDLFPVKWKLQSSDFSENWSDLFFKEWLFHDQRNKKGIKQRLQLHLMPMQISWHYLACAEVRRLYHAGVSLTSLDFCMRQLAVLCEDYNLIPHKDEKLRLLNMQIMCGKVRPLPFSGTSGRMLSNHEFAKFFFVRPANLRTQFRKLLLAS